MATNYGGNMADAFAKGMQSGYGFVDKALTNKQTRDTKQFKQDRAEEIYSIAQEKEQAIQSASQEQKGDTAINAETQEQIKTQDTAMKQETGNKMTTVLNNYRASDTAETSKDAIADSQTAFSNSSSLQKSAGVQNPKSIAELDLNNPDDMKYMDKNLSSKGVTMENYHLDPDSPEDVATWEAMRKEMLPLMSLMKVDGVSQDADELAAVTGADSKASVETKKKIKATHKKQEQVVTKMGNSQLDKKIANVTSQLTAAGYDVNTTMLKTPEQKEEWLETQKKRVMSESVKPREEGATPSTPRKEVSKEYINTLYSLAGITPPKDARTAKMQNVDFLVKSGMSRKDAITNQYPSAKTADHRSKVEKWMDARTKAEGAGQTDVVDMYDNLLEKEAYIKEGKDKEFLTLLDELDTLKDPASERGQYLKKRLDYLTTKNSYGGGSGSKAQKGLSKAYEIQGKEVGEMWTDLGGVERTITKEDLDWAGNQVYSAEHTSGMKDTDAVVTASSGNNGTVTNGKYTPPSKSQNSDNYTKVYKGSTKNAQAAIDADEGTTRSLERRGENISKLQRAVESGDFKSGLGVNQWNNLMTKIPFDEARDWTVGDAKTYLQAQYPDMNNLIVDILSNEIKGAASDKDMEMVSEMVGKGNFSPESMLDIMKRAQSNGVNTAKGNLQMNHQRPYLERLNAITVDDNSGKPTKVKDTRSQPPKAEKVETAKKDTRPQRTANGETRYWDGAKWVK